MPLTLKMLVGHIAFDLSVARFMPPVTLEPCMLGSWNFIYGFLMEYRSYALFEVMPLLRNEMEILLGRYLDIWYTYWGWGADYLVNFWGNSITFWRSYGPLKVLSFSLLARYFENHSSLGLDICSADWGWGVDYLLNFCQNSIKC